MKFINVDPFATGMETERFAQADFELYRDGKFLIDLHGNCTFQGMLLENSTLVATFKVGWKDATQEDRESRGEEFAAIWGREFTLHFKDVVVKAVEMEGEDLDDMGRLEHLRLLGKGGDTVQIQIAASVLLTFNCSSAELVGI